MGQELTRNQSAFLMTDPLLVRVDFAILEGASARAPYSLIERLAGVGKVREFLL